LLWLRHGLWLLGLLLLDLVLVPVGHDVLPVLLLFGQPADVHLVQVGFGAGILRRCDCWRCCVVVNVVVEREGFKVVGRDVGQDLGLRRIGIVMFGPLEGFGFQGWRGATHCEKRLNQMFPSNSFDKC
jgi:hypothetical protein